MAPVSPQSAPRRFVRFGHRVALTALSATALGIGAIELAQPNETQSTALVLTCLCVIAASVTFLGLESSQRRRRRSRRDPGTPRTAAGPALITRGRAEIVTARARPAGAVPAPSAPHLDAAPPVLITEAGPEPGDVLGSYQLIACLGEGSLGRTWAARQMNSTLERIVTIQTTGSSEPAAARRRFIGEARVASLLRHPNVCGAYETGSHDGVLYRVLEWCDGASLRELLERLPGQRMEARVAALIVAKVSAGVHAAHELEDEDGARLHVVHGALSPRDVHISRKGQVKVSGFVGAAERLGAAAAGGYVSGPDEPPYLAPEQRGGAVDARTDVFALGCLLYEATLGRSPLGAGRPGEPAEEPPAPRTVLPDYPAELEAIVQKALEPAPAARHASAEGLGVALRAWVTRSGGVMMERMIADLMQSAAGALVERRAEQLRDALQLWPRPAAPGIAGLTAHPGAPVQDTGSAAGRAEPERPTLPAAPRARKSHPH